MVRISKELARWLDAHPNAARVYIHLIAEADERGEVVVSQRGLGDRLGLSRQNVRTAIKTLCNQGLTHVQPTSNPHANPDSTLITICGYDGYTGASETPNPPTNPRSTQGQPKVNPQRPKNFAESGFCEAEITPPRAEARKGARVIGTSIDIDVKDRIKENNLKNRCLHNDQKNGLSEVEAADAALSEASSDAEVVIEEVEVEEIEKDEVREIVDYYNAERVAAKSAMPKAIGINRQRRGFVQARLRERGRKNVETVIRKAVRSYFLNGGGNTAFRASFDWIMRPTNFDKVLEGNYDNRQTTGGARRNDDLENLASGLAELIRNGSDPFADDGPPLPF